MSRRFHWGASPIKFILMIQDTIAQGQWTLPPLQPRFCGRLKQRLKTRSPKDTIKPLVILWISSQETDYLADLTYAGLTQILGKQKVVDFPFHWSYHREKRFFWNRKNEYPSNLGWLQTDRPSRGFSILEIKKNLDQNEFQMVVLSSAKPDALECLAQLLPAIKVPWVFVDGGDWQELGGDFKRTGGQKSQDLFQTILREQPPALVFKREMPSGFKNEWMFPFPFSAQISRLPKFLPAQQKKYQVLFWAVESSGVRREAFKLLRGRYDCDQNGSVAGQKSRRYAYRGPRYFEALSQTRIVLSFRGEGFDTLRFWEAPACGSLLLSEKPFIQIPNGFEDRVHAVFCNPDLSDLLTLIDYYLSHEKEAEAIAQAGQKHLLKYHTPLKRGEYFLEKVASVLKIRFEGSSI